MCVEKRFHPMVCSPLLLRRMYLGRAVRVGNTVPVVCGDERHAGAGVDGGDVSGVHHGHVEEVRRVVIHRHLQSRTRGKYRDTSCAYNK